MRKEREIGAYFRDIIMGGASQKVRRGPTPRYASGLELRLDVVGDQTAAEALLRLVLISSQV